MKRTLRPVLRILAGILAFGWSSLAGAQIVYPTDDTVSMSVKPAIKVINTGSKSTAYFVGQAYGQDPILQAESTSSATAGKFVAVNQGGLPAVSVFNTSYNYPGHGVVAETTYGHGVHGTGSEAGVYGYGDYSGVYGVTRGGGVSGASGFGVFGRCTTGSSSSPSPGFGVKGTGDYGTAGYFISYNSGHGVIGETTATAGNGVWGLTANQYACGVYGTNSSSSSGYGVAGRTTQAGWAVYGDTGSYTAGYSGFFTGKVAVLGLLSKGGGSFKIDHPLDPANKFLYHSFVESPDMKNIYDGVAVLDSAGNATVQLPAWFSTLNRDFRYQLTSIGKFSPVFVAAEIGSTNQFTISGGSSGQKISWQVTGIRQDAFANENRIPVEEDKSPAEKGKYLHPTAFGLSPTLSLAPPGPVEANRPQH